jgi:hypothetical protein
MSSLDNDDWGLIRHFGARDVDELMAFRVGGDGRFLTSPATEENIRVPLAPSIAPESVCLQQSCGPKLGDKGVLLQGKLQCLEVRRHGI